MDWKRGGIAVFGYVKRLGAILLGAWWLVGQVQQAQQTAEQARSVSPGWWPFWIGAGAFALFGLWIRDLYQDNRRLRDRVRNLETSSLWLWFDKGECLDKRRGNYGWWVGVCAEGAEIIQAEVLLCDLVVLQSGRALGRVPEAVLAAIKFPLNPKNNLPSPFPVHPRGRNTPDKRVDLVTFFVAHSRSFGWLEIKRDSGVSLDDEGLELSVGDYKVSLQAVGDVGGRSVPSEVMDLFVRITDQDLFVLPWDDRNTVDVVQEEWSPITRPDLSVSSGPHIDPGSPYNTSSDHIVIPRDPHLEEDDR